MTTADAVVRAALSVVGQTEDPPGSNICPITRELDANFPRINGATRSGTAWCGSFAFWALWKAGYPVDPRGGIVVNDVFLYSFYTPADVNAWRKAGRWLDWRETPPVGALVYYDWQGTHGTTSVTDHVGIVTAVTTAGVVCTVEGNTAPAGFVSEGGGVYTFGPGGNAPARPHSMIVGYGLPLYTPETSGDDDPMTYLGQLVDGSVFVRGSGTARRVNAEELASVYKGQDIVAIPAGSYWEAWVTKELAAYDAAVGA